MAVYFSAPNPAQLFSMEYFFQLGLVLAGGAVTILAGFLANSEAKKRVLVELKAADERRRNNFLIERAEELHITFADWVGLIVSNNYSLKKVMTDELTYDEHLDFVINSSQKDREWKKVELAINAYFSDLADQYEEVMKTLHRMNTVVARHKELYKQGVNDRTLLEDFEAFEQAFLMAANRLKDNILLTVRRIVTGRIG